MELVREVGSGVPGSVSPTRDSRHWAPSGRSSTESPGAAGAAQGEGSGGRRWVEMPALWPSRDPDRLQLTTSLPVTTREQPRPVLQHRSRDSPRTTALGCPTEPRTVADHRQPSPLDMPGWGGAVAVQGREEQERGEYLGWGPVLDHLPSPSPSFSRSSLPSIQTSTTIAPSGSWSTALWPSRDPARLEVTTSLPVTIREQSRLAVLHHHSRDSPRTSATGGPTEPRTISDHHEHFSLDTPGSYHPLNQTLIKDESFLGPVVNRCLSPTGNNPDSSFISTPTETAPAHCVRMPTGVWDHC
ncbi:uncharacterized protein LOC119930017 [Tachyglossus aculeatus]|uniref:uncharacterized protein LOC119930017 n=1 Tax=Tachyglossus aculeatus TaxID=9261 RepID=UPI0018F6489C|nr:uncharacterized protein LOC119930017 [Tachyglossus aculeatus]